MISVAVCSLLYAIKGGQHGWLTNPLKDKAWDRSIPFGWLIERLLDGKFISSVGFGFLTGSPLAGLAWLAGVAPSIGEQIGAVGGYKGSWRPEGKAWGWKFGLQRGVFTGALLALALNDTDLIIAGALFPVCYWLGVSFEQWRTGKIPASWRWAEWIYGAVIGLGVAL